MPAPPPPLGWGSWNSFSNTVDSKIVVQQAKAMVSSGLRAAGYKYVLIDEGWWLGTRDAKGNITVNPQQWPALAPGEKNGDMANIARYLHGLGLKPAIYTDAGSFGCSYLAPDIGPPEPHTGSLGHYDQDFLQFARWGFDYVKVDWCGGAKPNLDPAVQYGAIARAIERAAAFTGRTLYFSICDWGRQSPWTWAPGIGGLSRDMWRAGGDITAPIVDDPLHAHRRVSLANVLRNFDAGMHPQAQHTGYYNDLDMMVIGMRGMSLSADRVHMSLWSISGAPLILGADLTKLTKPQIEILANPEVLAVDQDPLGVQCIKVSGSKSGVEVWAKPLAQPGSRAVVLLNRRSYASRATVTWSSLGLDPASAAQVRDLWARKNLGPHTTRFQATIPPHGVMTLRITGKAKIADVYRPDELVRKERTKDRSSCVWCSADAYDKEVTESFSGIRARTVSTYVTIDYVNKCAAPVIGQLQADGQDATNVQFPSTLHTASGVGTVVVEVNLQRSSARNTVKISSTCPHSSFHVVALEVSRW